MIGQAIGEDVACVWLDADRAMMVSICEPTFLCYRDRISEADKVTCPDCLRIAAQIAKDAKTLEGETG